jgi:hypothetical protein
MPIVPPIEKATSDGIQVFGDSGADLAAVLLTGNFEGSTGNAKIVWNPDTNDIIGIG